MTEAKRSFPAFGRVELFSLVVVLLLALGTCLLLGAVPAKAADVTMVEYGSNPVYDPPNPSDKAYYPCVLYDANQFSSHGASYYYKMWYADGTGQFEAVTYSNDGITWSAPVQTAGILASGYHARIIYIPGGYSATGGTYYYKIWYWDSAVHDVPYTIDGIRTADSVDGENFVNDATITQNATAQLVINPDTGFGWNRGTYGPVDVHYNASATNTGTNPFDYTFAMYYDSTDGGVESMGLGYSADGNTDWHGYGSGPVLNYGSPGDWDSDYASYGTVIHDAGGAWHMWYSGSGPSGGANQGIGYATSSDGLTWTKDPGNPLFSIYQGVAWRNNRCYTPSVLYSPTRFDGHGAGAVYKMWFTGEASATSNRTIGYAESPPTTVWVDTTYSPGSAGGHTYGYDAFSTVQGGINGVAAGGNVIVYAGTYNEAPIINKHVTVTGEDRTTTIINGGDPYSVQINATDVSFSGFTVMNPGYTGGSDASGIVIEPPTGSPSNIHVFNNIVRDIGDPNTACVSYGRVGINIGGPDGPVEVDHNEVYNIKHNGNAGPWAWANGISIWGMDPSQPANNVDVHDNYIHDIYCPLPKAAGISTQADVKGLKLRNNRIEKTKDYGIETRGGSQDGTLIQGNQIYGSSSPGIVTGIRCSDPFAADLSSNILAACQIGVLVEEHDPTWGGTAASVQPVVHLNRISVNTTFGLQNSISGDTDAIKNWWGSAYGPWTASHTGGDRVSGLATTNPWCTNSTLTEICSFPTNLVPKMTAGIFSIPVGDTEPSAAYVNAADRVVLNVTQGTTTHSVTLPTGTRMTASSGNFNTANLVANFAPPASLTGFAPRTVVHAGLQFGLPGQVIDFSSPVTVRLEVGSALNGKRLNVFRSVTGTSGWTVDGIGTPTPLVSGGVVTFTATKASYYAAVTPASGATGSSFYFAEGYTANNFAEYLCVGNPNTAAATVHVKYLFVDGTSQAADYPVPGKSRITVFVNDVVGQNREVSMVVTSTTSNLVAERPMYFDYNGTPGNLNWTGGHDVVGATRPGLSWYFAEGYTGPGFDDYVTVLNPGGTDAALAFKFQTQEAGLIVKSGFTVHAHSRGTFKVNDVLGANFQTSLKLESNQPVVAERPMYFDYTGVLQHSWTGGSCVVGAPALAKQYYFAEGTTRNSVSNGSFEEWLTLQNPSSGNITINATYQLGDGQGENVTKSYVVGPGMRSTVFVPDEVGQNKDVSVLLTSTSDFLAERPEYFDYNDAWTGGHCVIGSTATGRNWFLAEGYTGTDFQEWLTLQNAGSKDATVQITYFTLDNGVKGPYNVVVPAGTRKTVNVNEQAGPNLQLSAQVVSDQPVVVERPMYFNYNGAWTGGHDVIGHRY